MSSTGPVHRILLFLALLPAGSATASASATGQNTYCDPLAGCAPAHLLRVAPASVRRGRSVTVSGRTGHRCTATVYSRAFKGASHSFAGVPAITVKTNKRGVFSAQFRIRNFVKPGKYSVAGRCGGAKFGSATLRVKG